METFLARVIVVGFLQCFIAAWAGVVANSKIGKPTAKILLERIGKI